MKKIHLMAMMVMMLCVLSGCTNYAKKYDKNTLVVKGNDSLVEIAVEDFKDSSVKVEDLSTYIDEQVEIYNKNNGKKVVKKKSINTEDMSNVKLVLTYKDMESYNGFNLLECKLDDFSNVKESDLTGSFTSMEGKTVKIADMKETKKAKVLILSEAANIVVSGDILYYNKEVSVKDETVTTTGDGNAVIVFK